MALNETQFPGRHITVALAGVNSGDPVAVGQLTGVAETATQADGNVVLDCSGAVYAFTVVGTNGANVAVAFGDIIYCTQANSVLTRLNKTTSGVPFGIALGALASGATGIINVKTFTV